MTKPDFTLDLEEGLSENVMPIDEAIEIACKKLGLPLLGGPSGRGWSFHSTAQRCPHLFRAEHLVNGGRETRHPSMALQVGALYHTLQALFYGPGLGPCLEVERGLIGSEALKARRGRKPQMLEIPETAADMLLSELKLMADPLEEDLTASLEKKEPSPRPSRAVIMEAEACFDAHTGYYNGGVAREDVTTLAIEWFALNEALEYTCRYDHIGRLGPNDPLGLPAGSVVIFERKTSRWLSEMAQIGWFLDGEILGQILNWQPSGCQDLFGPLAAVVVDIVTKQKSPQFLRVVVPPTVPAVDEHGRWIRYTQAQMRQWSATGVYPKYFTQCFDRWGKCGMWESCARGDKL